ncbi:hypothetical protein LBW59_15885 [Ralstonia solanacearum]|uniref:Uncharacterized protein n=1 Tax=Ralstonia solanacearum TaxID=305 RepID=A0AAW5ZQ81_RALSL|nr:phage tail tube protein [Ralstonia solanacearum]MDB0543052.1 hypothetical protein [Ralstonia solanacearum]MDB0552734.1 hypothetical protein [Ralstonia solanacearum]MDB0557512.1 hypothetical protein [Ralstonia solanacearum]MDB0572242.1 hypothetical protein [Ralstonia solanacearum]QNT25506.1 hypothetical protein C2I38_25980 [Ralstonia solanacearum]
MSKMMRKALILAALEVGGVAAAPTAANAILVRNINPTPIAGQNVSRDVIRPYFGNSEQLPGSVHSEIEFEVELAGAGAAGHAPGWGPLLRACSFAELVTDGVDVQYHPITDGGDTLTIHYYLDGLFHKLTGARGTVSFELNSEQIPVMKYKFTGFYSPVADAIAPAGIDFAAFVTPRVVGKLNTPQWGLMGYTGKLESCSIDVANQVVFQTMVGGESIDITDRKPAGSVVLELGRVADKDWWGAILNVQTGAFSITHGTTAGNIVKIDAPKVQLSQPTYQDKNGKAMLSAQVVYAPQAGNDELLITVK